MTVPRKSLCFRVLCPRSRSLLLIIENLCHHSGDFIYTQIFFKLHKVVKHHNALKEIEFQGDKTKVKVTITIYRKSLSLLWRLHFLPDFDQTSYIMVKYKYASTAFVFQSAMTKVTITSVLARFFVSLEQMSPETTKAW